VTEPRRWLDSGSAISPDVRRLLEAVDKPQTMRPDERIGAWQKIEMLDKVPLPPRPTFLLRPLLGTGPKIVAALLAAITAGGAPFVAKFFSERSPAPSEQVVPALSSSVAPGLTRELLPQPRLVASDVPVKPLAAPPGLSSVTSLPRSLKGSPETNAAPRNVAPPRSLAMRTNSVSVPAEVRGEKMSPPVSPSASPSGSAPAKSSILPELELFWRAQRLVKTNPDEAVLVLDRLAREYPSGVTRYERDLLRIEALRNAGHTEDARARAQRLLEQSRGQSNAGKARQMEDSLP